MNFDITNALVVLAFAGYLFTGILTLMNPEDRGDFHDLTQDVILAVIAFGKSEIKKDGSQNKEDKDKSLPPLPPRPKNLIK